MSIRRTLLTLCFISLAPLASGQMVPMILNQSNVYQDPGWFQIGHDLSDLQAVGEFRFANSADSTSTYGIHILGDLNPNKGFMTGIRARTEADNFAGQAGVASMNGAHSGGFFSSGTFRGVAGWANPKTLSNFSAGNTSQAAGGFFSVSPLDGGTLFLDDFGTYNISGVEARLSGCYDGNPGLGTIAALLAVDDADTNCGAPHWAGYFVGDVNVTGALDTGSDIDAGGDLAIRGGDFVIDSPIFPGTRTLTMFSQSRQEMHATNDFVLTSGANFEIRPDMNGAGTRHFRVSNPNGTPFFSVSPVNQSAVVGTGASAEPGYELTVRGDIWCQTLFEQSSRRHKTDIQTLKGSLETVNQLRGVRYARRDDGSTEVGFIAEEVAEVLPEIVDQGEDGLVVGINYGRITAVLVEAMKEQQSLIEEQSAELRDLRSTLEDLRQDVANLPR